MHRVEVDAVDGGSEVLGYCNSGDTYHVLVRCDLQALCQVTLSTLISLFHCIALTGFIDTSPPWRFIWSGGGGVPWWLVYGGRHTR